MILNEYPKKNQKALAKKTQRPAISYKQEEQNHPSYNSYSHPKTIKTTSGHNIRFHHDCSLIC